MELREPSDASKAYHILALVAILSLVVALSVGLTVDALFEYLIKASWAFVNPFLELCVLCALTKMLYPEFFAHVLRYFKQPSVPVDNILDDDDDPVIGYPDMTL